MGRLHNQTGIGLVELLVAVAASVAVFAGVGGLLRLLFVTNIRIPQSNQSLTNLTLANEHITRVGRLSQRCTKYIPANGVGAASIQCNLDFQGTGAILPAPNVQFVISPAGLLYQTVLPNGSWNTQLTYTGIIQFDICDSSDLANSNCALNSTDGSGVNNFATSNPNFFRFRMRGTDYLGGYSLSGSFFTRGSAINKSGSVTYGWAGVLK